MSELVGGGSQYTDEQRKQAIVDYAIKGNISHVAKTMNIPRKTVSDWLRQDWAVDLIAEIRHQNQDQHISQYHELTRRSLELALEGVDQLQGKDLSAGDIKALVVTGATATDKARLLQSTSHTEQASQVIADIANTLTEVGKVAAKEYARLREKREATTIDVTPNPGSTDS